MSRGLLSYEEITVHYIYSYLFSFMDFDLFREITNFEYGVPSERRHQLAPILRFSRHQNGNKKVKTDKVISKCFQNDSINDKPNWVQKIIRCSGGDGSKINQNITLPCKIRSISQIRDCGMGTHTIAIKIEKHNIIKEEDERGDVVQKNLSIDLNYEVLQKLFRLTERVSSTNKYGLIVDDAKQNTDGKYLFDLFSDDLSKLIDKVNSVNETKAKNLRFEYFDESVLKPFQKYDHSRVKIKPDKSDKEATENEQKATSYQPNQNPFIVTMIKLSNELYRDIFINNSYNKECVTKELGAILFRTIGFGDSSDSDTLSDLNYINMDYILKNIGLNQTTGLPPNMAMDNRVYYSFHPRSCLVAYSDEDAYPASFLIPSILNITEAIRARWHAGNIINAYLDDAIHILRDNPKYENVDFLILLAKLQSAYTQFLEDPIVHNFDGGSMTALAKKAYDMYWMSYIKDVTSQKFKFISDLYKSQKEIIQSDEFMKYLRGKGEQSI